MAAASARLGSLGNSASSNNARMNALSTENAQKKEIVSARKAGKEKTARKDTALTNAQATESARLKESANASTAGKESTALIKTAPSAARNEESASKANVCAPLDGQENNVNLKPVSLIAQETEDATTKAANVSANLDGTAKTVIKDSSSMEAATRRTSAIAKLAGPDFYVTNLPAPMTAILKLKMESAFLMANALARVAGQEKDAI